MSICDATSDALIKWPAQKDPAAEKPYGLDWTRWLDGNALFQSTWEIDPLSGVTIAQDVIQGNQTLFWPLGGIAGEYVVKNTIVDSNGNTEVRRRILVIAET